MFSKKVKDRKDDDAVVEGSKLLTEGIDFYMDSGLMVLTGTFLKNRGYCCNNGCRHCPYEESDPEDHSK